MTCEHCDLPATNRIEASDGTYVTLCDECAALVVRPNTAWQRKEDDATQRAINDILRSGKKHNMFGKFHS